MQSSTGCTHAPRLTPQLKHMPPAHPPRHLLPDAAHQHQVCTVAGVVPRALPGCGGIQGIEQVACRRGWAPAAAAAAVQYTQCGCVEASSVGSIIAKSALRSLQYTHALSVLCLTAT
jgi:hypothetical protein